MTLYWRSKGKSLLQRMEELYSEYGYFEDRAISKNFPGASGVQTMANIMSKLRKEKLTSLAGLKVLKIRDVGESLIYDLLSGKKETCALPKSNVLQFFLEGGTVVSARPSGTEPKIKFYINAATKVIDGNLQKAKEDSASLCEKITKEINAILEANS